MSHYLLCDRERGGRACMFYMSRVEFEWKQSCFRLNYMSQSLLKYKQNLGCRSLFHYSIYVQCVGCVCSCTQFGYCSQFRWQSLNTLSFGWSLGTGYAVIKYIHYCFCNTLGIFSSYSIFASLSEPQRRKAFGCFCAHILIAREWVELLLHSPGITHEYCYCYCDR